MTISLPTPHTAMITSDGLAQTGDPIHGGPLIPNSRRNPFSSPHWGLRIQVHTTAEATAGTMVGMKKIPR